VKCLSATAGAVLFAASLAAQYSQYNPFVVFPQDPERQFITCASFVGRPDLANAAEAHQEINAAWLRGVSDSQGGSLVFGFYHWAADENLSTAESYAVVLRTDAPGGGPDASSNGVIVRVGGLTTPPWPSLSRGTWRMTDGFATPVSVGGVQAWFMGIDLPASPNWPASDGQSLYRADTPAALTGAPVGEDPRAGAPEVTWGIVAGRAPFTTPWTWLMGVLSDTPNLHVGGLDPGSARIGTPGASNLGMGGLFPDIRGPRRDGLTVRLTDNFLPGSGGAIGIAPGFAAPHPILGLGAPFFGFCHIRNLEMLTVGFGLLNGGALELPVAAPNTIPTALVGLTFAFQGFVVTPFGTGALSSAQAVTF
jgi:hypothetical protein